MSMMVSFVLSFFPRDVLDEILNFIGSVSEGFPSYSFRTGDGYKKINLGTSLLRSISRKSGFLQNESRLSCKKIISNNL